jgi:hypothetical protein
VFTTYALAVVDGSTYRNRSGSSPSGPASTASRGDGAAREPVLAAVLDSSHSGGSTPQQRIVRVVPSRSSDAKPSAALQFSMQLFLDHSMTEVRF